MNELTEQKTIFATFLGVPNAGKSTLTNHLVGTKVSIVTPKVQTTRARMTGIVMVDNTQVVLVDTPGIFKPKKQLDQAMVKAAWNEVGGADVNALLVDAKACQNGLDEGTEAIIKGLSQRGGHSILIFNKIDAVRDKTKLLALSEACYKLHNFDTSFMISAQTGSGVNDLKRYLVKQARVEPWPFDPEEVSTIPNRLFAAEMTREQLMLSLQHELPYELMVETESYEEKVPTRREKNGSLHIKQVIYVSKDGHKRIVVGKQGATLKKIGEAARKSLGYYLGVPVHLFLFVKVDPKWQQKSSSYRAMGFDA